MEADHNQYQFIFFVILQQYIPFFQVTQVAGRGTLYPRDCAMDKHFSIKIKELLKDLRGKDDLWYDCLLEQEARRKQENPEYNLDSFYGTVLVKYVISSECCFQSTY
ncbi:hypothetical protein ANCCAN_25844 [Ancylostoma caninum]|uniref:Uncharacterized protein n=1 Tax=Ancylostoma caninum TaxID=29170 RepID=A0A368F8M5_ANCCA|nr:hypothetical protein ANCCAN_25844 [Ancylostoma caninum]